MDDYAAVETMVEDCAQRLFKLMKEQPGNRGVLYTAGRMLKCFNELFAMNWEDMQIAEERMKERGKT